MHWVFLERGELSSCDVPKCVDYMRSSKRFLWFTQDCAEPECTVMLLGNKLDLADDGFRKVKSEMADKLAKVKNIIPLLLYHFLIGHCFAIAVTLSHHTLPSFGYGLLLEKQNVNPYLP